MVDVDDLAPARSSLERRRAEAEAEAAPIPDGELARVGADPGEP